MAEGKKSFVLYVDQRELFDQLTDEYAGKLIKHIFSYCSDEYPKTDDMMLKLAFTPLKLQLKRDLKKYEKIVERNRINGAKGGRPKKPSGLSGNPSKPKKADNDNDNDNDINIEGRKAKFKKLLIPFQTKYRVAMLKEFFEYWTEHGDKDKKMRFEKEKSYNLKSRLTRWSNSPYNKESSNNKPGKLQY